MELDDLRVPQPTGEFEQLEADSLVLALGQDTDLSLMQDVDGIEISDGVVHVDEGMMTGAEGIFAGGDMVPSERTVTVAVGHGKQGRPQHRRLAARYPVRARPRPPLATFDRLNTWYYTDAPKTVRPTLIRPDGCPRSTRSSRVSMSRPRCTRRGGACPAATASAVTTASGSAPTTRVLKLPRGSAEGDNGRDYAFDLDYCKGCGICVSECPSGAIIMIPEA